MVGHAAYSFVQTYYPVMVHSERYPLVKRWNSRLARYEWAESEPDACPQCGAQWKPGAMRRGWVSCPEHDGHRTWRCVACDEMTLNPPHEGEIKAETMPSLQPGHGDR